MKKKMTLLTAGICLQVFAFSAQSETTIEIHKVNESGTAESIGSVAISVSKKGVVFTPNLSGLTPGLHGFHVHENGSCLPTPKDGEVTPAGAAGDHLNLNKAKHHGTPWGEGHTGDLPALFVDDYGKATHPVFAPKLSMKDIKGKAIIIHQGGDNYSDQPSPLGGGGARVACGMIGEKK